MQSILNNDLKASHGQLWNTSMPYVRKMPGLRTITSNACSLYYLEDYGSHLLGGCKHRDMIKSYTERHNDAGRLINSPITMGTSGNNIFIANLSTRENMQGMGALDTRLSCWLKRPPSEGCSKMGRKGTKRMTHWVTLHLKTGVR